MSMQDRFVVMPDFLLGETVSAEDILVFEPFLNNSPGGQVRGGFLPIEAMEGNVLGDEDSLIASPVVLEEVKEETVLLSLHEDLIRELKVQHQKENKELAETNKNDLASQIENAFASGFEYVHEEITKKLSVVLSKISQDKLSKTSVESLLSEVKNMLTSRNLESLKLCGPENLVEAAEQAFQSFSIQVDSSITDTLDLVIVLDEQIISTCIATWAGRLERALQDES